jgi:hypothetical protein
MLITIRAYSGEELGQPVYETHRYIFFVTSEAMKAFSGYIADNFDTLPVDPHSKLPTWALDGTAEFNLDELKSVLRHAYEGHPLIKCFTAHRVSKRNFAAFYDFAKKYRCRPLLDKVVEYVRSCKPEDMNVDSWRIACEQKMPAEIYNHENNFWNFALYPSPSDRARCASTWNFRSAEKFADFQWENMEMRRNDFDENFPLEKLEFEEGSLAGSVIRALRERESRLMKTMSDFLELSNRACRDVVGSDLFSIVGRSYILPTGANANAAAVIDPLFCQTFGRYKEAFAKEALASYYISNLDVQVPYSKSYESRDNLENLLKRKSESDRPAVEVRRRRSRSPVPASRSPSPDVRSP